MREPPDRSSPFARASALGPQIWGRPDRHASHRPQAAENWKITESPTFTSRTEAPTSTTSPAPSCPSTTGTPRPSTPEMIERSEWHSPPPRILTTRSVGSGGSSVTSSIASGRLSA